MSKVIDFDKWKKSDIGNNNFFYVAPLYSIHELCTCSLPLLQYTNCSKVVRKCTKWYDFSLYKSIYTMWYNISILTAII